MAALPSLADARLPSVGGMRKCDDAPRVSLCMTGTAERLVVDGRGGDARVRVRLGGSLQPVKLSCRGAAERVRLEGIRLSRGRRALDDHSGRDTRCGVGAVERQMHHVNRGWVGKRSRAAGTFAVNATRPVPRVC